VRIPTTPFRDQVVNLQALHLEEANPALALLCPVHALRIYVDRTQCFRTSDQLFVCYGGKLKGKDPSKQRLSHWNSGHHCFGRPAARSTMPPWCDCPLHLECGVLLGTSAWYLANRHL